VRANTLSRKYEVEIKLQKVYDPRPLLAGLQKQFSPFAIQAGGNTLSTGDGGDGLLALQPF
jgi:hypothetical protein